MSVPIRSRDTFESSAAATILTFTAIAIACLPSPSLAHGLGILGEGSNDEIASELAATLGPDVSFTAKGLLTEKTATSPEPREMEVVYFVSGGKIRAEKDYSTLRVAGKMPAYVAYQVKNGSDQTVTIADTGRGTMYTIYPRLEGYVEYSEPPKPGGAAPPKLERRPAGREEIEGRMCERYEVTTTEAGEQSTITIWETADPDRLPVRVRAGHQGLTTTLTFRDLKRSSLPPSVFAPPEKYTRYGSGELAARMLSFKEQKPAASGVPAPSSTAPR